MGLCNDEILALQILGTKAIHIIEVNKKAVDSGWDNEAAYWVEFLQDSFSRYEEMEERTLQSALSKAKSLLRLQREKGIQTLSFFNSDYPLCLKRLKCDAPLLIHFLGNTQILKRENQVAIIGARSADREGCDVAYKLGMQYGKQHVVVSGLALGCDTAAHRGCLDVNGETVAIVATGLNKVHPRENEYLQRNILSCGGLVLSEQPWGVDANPKRLVARNRLQAALAETVIVAQCPVNSGTMYTVRFGQKYGKKICTVRGVSRECNSGNLFLLESGQAEEIVI